MQDQGGTRSSGSGGGGGTSDAPGAARMKDYKNESLFEKDRGPLFVPKLYAALSKAQGVFPDIPKTKTVDFSHNGKRTFYKYADLADIFKAIRPGLKENGLSVIQKFDEESQLLTTILAHESGEILTSTIGINTKALPQALGSQLTYFRRYQLAGIVGVSADEDDDGQGAQNNAQGNKKGNPQPKPKPKPKPRDPNSLVTESELKYLYTVANNKDIPSDLVKQYVKAVYGYETTKSLTFQEYSKVGKAIKSFDADAIGMQIVELTSEKELASQEPADFESSFTEGDADASNEVTK